MPSTVITIKTDPETKKAAEDLAADAGLTLDELVNCYLKQVVATRHIDLRIPQKMTPKLEKLLGEAEADIKRGDVSGPYDNVEDFLKDLNS